MPARRSSAGLSSAPAERMIRRAAMHSPPDLNADGAPAVHHQTIDLHTRADGKVRTPARRGVEIAHRGRAARLAIGGQRHREPAIREHRVLVADIAIPRRRQRLHRRAGEAGPFLRHHPADGDRTGRAVQRAVIIHIGLELAEIRQHPLPVPAIRAQRRPFIVIRGQAAVADLAVHAGAAADHARLDIGFRRRRPRIVVRDRHQPGAQIAPLIGGVEGGAVGIDVADFLGLPPRREIGSGFDQQDAVPP